MAIQYITTASTLALNLYYNRQLISGTGTGTTLSVTICENRIILFYWVGA
jgi:hypothetical protein